MQAIKARLHLGNVYAEHVGIHPSTQSLDFGRLETRFLGIDAEVIGEDNESTNSPEHRLRNRNDSGIKGSHAWTGVACRLSTFSLFECPEYVALSYSWGNQYLTRPIMLNGFPKHVTASLEVALRELRRRRVPTAWVDALCIDADNSYEKVCQLSQMSKIFSKASKVVVWLGPAADDSDDAMNALSAGKNGDEAIRHGVAIAKLLERPYWQRVWIIQEIAKASVVEVWCGPKTLTWNVFFTGVQRWWKTQGHHRGGLHHPIFTLKYFCDAERQSRKRAARMLLSAAMVRTLYLRKGYVEKRQSLRTARHCPRRH